MKKVFIQLFIVLISLQLISCKQNRLKVDISGIDAKVQLIRYDRLFFEAEDFQTLHNSYPRFSDLYTYKVIRIGGQADETFHQFLSKYLTDTMIVHTRKMVEEQFGNTEQLEKNLNKAFSHYLYYFPEKKVPAVYTFLSGFNQSVVIDEGIIGIGLDKYLGSNFGYYRFLPIPDYKLKKMYRERIPADVMYAWASAEFEKKGEESNLLSQMIHEGKLMYFVDAMLPDTPDTLKIGYTRAQLEWCRMNESKMWSTLIENKMLYSTKRMDIVRYTGDSPTTSGFPLESPGRTGNWIGWQIVRKFMEKNRDVTLPQLMNLSDSQKILNMSAYFPG